MANMLVNICPQMPLILWMDERGHGTKTDTPPGVPGTFVYPHERSDHLQHSPGGGEEPSVSVSSTDP